MFICVKVAGEASLSDSNGCGEKENGRKEKNQEICNTFEYFLNQTSKQVPHIHIFKNQADSKQLFPASFFPQFNFKWREKLFSHLLLNCRGSLSSLLEKLPATFSENYSSASFPKHHGAACPSYSPACRMLRVVVK